jgi:3-oxoacyl-[acyl-carrier protein] reductase
MGDFDGQVALVTGAAQGLGRSIATLLAGRGATVYLADLNGPGVETVVTDLRAQHLSASASCTDMADEPAVLALRDRIATEAGRLDVLINNAGGWLASAASGSSRSRPWRLRCWQTAWRRTSCIRSTSSGR